ncbi:ArnT family glycosyltransferase, partial [Limobrevibacterium gyesilva]|uniref:ArnT family glycosyltransferase n=1 Tax=Limobrevibacterium gyesilva TaxID=2991712 RepID=UPI002225BEB2
MLLGFVVLLQIHDGAYAADFDFDADSHYVSGLMIHDFITSLRLQSPLAFLKNFHSHYPIIGIGHWGPLYYVVEGLWMIPFSTGIVSVLMLSAVVTAATAAITYKLAAERFGRLAGIATALIFAAAPVIRESSNAVMLDGAIALLCVGAALAYIAYLSSGRALHSVLFGLIAAAAMLIKGNAACLALLPPFAVLIGRRFDLLHRPSFWIPVPVVATLAGPWVLFTYGQVAQGFRYSWGLTYLGLATAYNGHALMVVLGGAVVALGTAGFACVALGRRIWQHDNGLVGLASLLAAVWVFQSVMPAAFQDRYLMPMLPPLLILALVPVQAVAAWFAAKAGAERALLRDPRRMMAAASVILAGTFALGTRAIEPPPDFGFRRAAQQVWANRISTNPSVLIGAEREGSAIAALAMADPHRPSLFAVRGSRLLGGGGYNQQDYAPRFATAREVMAAIDEYAIPLVLLRVTGRAGEWQHLRQLAEAQALYPDRWELIYRDPSVSPELRLYRIRGNDAKVASEARLLA